MKRTRSRRTTRRRRFFTRSRRSYQGPSYYELLPFNVKSGSQIQLKISDLKARASSLNFKPLWARIQFSRVFAGTSGTPSALQCAFLGPEGEVNSMSPVHICGSVPQYLNIKYPRSADWWPYNNVPAEILFQLHCICLGGDSTSHSEGIVGMITMKIATQLPMVPMVCPKVLRPPSDETHIDADTESMSNVSIVSEHMSA